MLKTRLQTKRPASERPIPLSPLQRSPAWRPGIWLLALCLANTAAAQTPDASYTALPVTGHRFVRWAWHDAFSLASGIDGPFLLWSAGGIAALAGLTPLDEPVRDRAESGAGELLNDFSDGANFLAEPYVAIPATVGLFGVSLITRDAKFQDAAFTSAQSLAYASGVTLVLKMLLGRHRPRESRSAYRFDPLSGHQAFPSGHTTAMFAMLVPWAMYYPHPATWSLVALGGSGTALGRILMNKHWLTDVLGGATIGIVTGVLLSRLHLNQTASILRQQTLQLYPSLGHRQAGFTLTLLLTTTSPRRSPMIPQTIP